MTGRDTKCRQVTNLNAKNLQHGGSVRHRRPIRVHLGPGRTPRFLQSGVGLGDDDEVIRRLHQLQRHVERERVELSLRDRWRLLVQQDHPRRELRRNVRVSRIRRVAERISGGLRSAVAVLNPRDVAGGVRDCSTSAVVLDLPEDRIRLRSHDVRHSGRVRTSVRQVLRKVVHVRLQKLRTKCPRRIVSRGRRDHHVEVRRGCRGHDSEQGYPSSRAERC